MLQATITYIHAQRNISKLFKEEGISISRAVMYDLMNFLSNLHIYEEEEKKIVPELIIGKNLATPDFETFAQCNTIVISKCRIKDNSFKKMLKPIIPFCDNEWRVFISVDNGYITYGILRSFSGPASLSITDNLLGYNEDELYGFKYILIDVLSKSAILLCGSKGNKLQINLGFVEPSIKNRAELLDNLTTDMLKDTQYPLFFDQQRQALTKLITLCSKRIHGAILLVVNSDYEIQNDTLLKDGVILSPPLNLIASLNEALSTRDVPSTSEKYYAMSGLLLTMMNTDGITVIDTQGKIRGYNIFIKSENADKQIVGGARKRAAYTLINSNNHNYCGVYFQSQDGDIIYERVNCFE